MLLNACPARLSARKIENNNKSLQSSLRRLYLDEMISVNVSKKK